MTGCLTLRALRRDTQRRDDRRVRAGPAGAVHDAARHARPRLPLLCRARSSRARCTTPRGWRRSAASSTAQIQTFVAEPAAGLLAQRDDHDDDPLLFRLFGRQGRRDDHPGYGAVRHLQSRATASRTRTATAPTTPIAAAAAPAARRTSSISRCTMTYPHIVPVGHLFGWSSNVTTTQNTVLRNQPYAARNTNRDRSIC